MATDLRKDWQELYERMSDILNAKVEGVFMDSAQRDKHNGAIHEIIMEVNQDCRDLALSMVAKGETPVLAMSTSICTVLETMFFLGYQIAQEGHEIKWCACEQRDKADLN